MVNGNCRGTREDMAAAAGGGTLSPGSVAPGTVGIPMGADPNATLMEDPDVWRPT
jgi:hypothetical protein